MRRAQHRTKYRVSTQNRAVPCAVLCPWHHCPAALRDSPRGSISVFFKHEDIAGIRNMGRLCFTHWQFLGTEGAGSREKNYLQKIPSAHYGSNCVSPFKEVEVLMPVPQSVVPHLERRPLSTSLVEMQSYCSGVGPSSRITGLLMRRWQREGSDRGRRSRDDKGGDEFCSHKAGNAEDGPKPPEARKGERRFPPWVSEGSCPCHLLDPGLLGSITVR